MATLCRAALRKGKSWPELQDRVIQEVAESWEHPDWLAVLENLRYIQDHPEGPSERYSRPYKLQQVAWHNQSKAGAELIMDISNVRRHLPEGFSRCSPTAYSPSITIELAELLYIQPAPADPLDSSLSHLHLWYNNLGIYICRHALCPKHIIQNFGGFRDVKC